MQTIKRKWHILPELLLGAETDTPFMLHSNELPGRSGDGTLKL
jgi:hypothetical protein